MKYLFKLIVFSLLTIKSFSFAQGYGAWQQIDSMKEARYSHSAIQLSDGRVLVVGGVGLEDPKSCEIYDINSNRWSVAAKTNYARWRHRLIMLDSKRILAVGSPITKSCEIYDPNLNAWILTDSLRVGRVLAQHQVVKLLDGRILVIGGSTDDYPVTEDRTLKLCEIFDEIEGKWSIADSLKTRRNSHSATLLKDGRVLVAGGTMSVDPLASCEIYDPVQNRWMIATPMNIARMNHNAVLLPNGKVLVIGGYGSVAYPKRSCELYDPVENKWEVVDSTKIDGSAYIIDDRNILLISANYEQYLVWEIYDYIESKSKYVGYFNTESSSNTKIHLSDGRILISGGVTTPDYFLYLPVKRCWMFDKNYTHVDEVNNQIDNNIFFQNYPNPFNGSTTIKFSVETTSNVQIAIYNVLGEKIEDLINERKERGYHQVMFSNVKLPSGVYFYNLTTGNNSITKKMILMK